MLLLKLVSIRRQVQDEHDASVVGRHGKKLWEPATARSKNRAKRTIMAKDPCCEVYKVVFARAEYGWEILVIRLARTLPGANKRIPNGVQRDHLRRTWVSVPQG